MRLHPWGAEPQSGASPFRRSRILRSASRPTKGNRLGLAIRLGGVSQGRVAAATGISQPCISDVARGRYATITLKNARKFAAYFRCSVDDLFPAELD